MLAREIGRGARDAGMSDAGAAAAWHWRGADRFVVWGAAQTKFQRAEFDGDGSQQQRGGSVPAAGIHGEARVRCVRVGRLASAELRVPSGERARNAKPRNAKPRNAKPGNAKPR